MFKPNKVTKKDPNQHFKNIPSSLKTISIKDFWVWAYSDLLQNTTRGVLAEYLLAVLLEVDDVARNPWDAYDLKLKDGTTIEVKTMSQLQGWAQSRLSIPKVVLGPTRAWNPLTGKMELEPTFNADIYIFCYFYPNSHSLADPMDLSQWLFYVLPQAKLIELLNGRKSISLKLLEISNVKPARADELALAVQAAKII